jgi:putative hydrolase of the HAD superfamily
MPTTPRFFYFDLGNVLATFTVERMLRQVHALCGVNEDRLRRVFFDEGLQKDYETGRIDSREFHERFCASAGTRPDADALRHAASDIFELNTPIVPIIASLALGRRPMGILSNTCEAHWRHCCGRFAMLGDLFDRYVLSYEVGAMKPDPRIFEHAVELAGCAPAEIFYTDDLPGHIEGARQVGLDAVQFTTAAALAEQLRQRGVTLHT